MLPYSTQPQRQWSWYWPHESTHIAGGRPEKLWWLTFDGAAEERQPPRNMNDFFIGLSLS